MNLPGDMLQATERALREAQPGSLVGMIHVHVRRIRQIAVALGHAQAAALPDAVATRLRDALRGSDHIYRIGSQDFMVLLPQLLSPGHAELAAQRLLREFERPLQVGDHLIMAVVALGLAWSPEHAGDADALARRATAAVDDAIARSTRLHLARGAGEDALLLEDLRAAIRGNELSLVFQPIVALRDRRIAALEALARWHCPRRGDVSPDRFVPLAEQGGLAADLTRWSLYAALREHADVLRSAPAVRCAINLSPRVFAEAGLVEQIVAALSIWGVPAASVVIEVTETAVIEDPEVSARTLSALRDVGLGVAIDDFGRGYSSFSYLRQFPATELKIDQSFTRDVVRDDRTRRLVGAMVTLAKGLGIETVCEGVEDDATLQVLVDLGCDNVQGYLLSRPMPCGDLGRWIASHSPATATTG